MQEIFESLGKNKKELFRLIFMEELTDIEAANQLHISRQYVHRMRKKYYEEIGYYAELENLSYIASNILIKMNYIRQKTNQTTSELKSFLNGIIGEKKDSTNNKLKEVSELINSSLEKTTVDEIQNEYNQVFAN